MELFDIIKKIRESEDAQERSDLFEHLVNREIAFLKGFTLAHFRHENTATNADDVFQEILFDIYKTVRKPSASAKSDQPFQDSGRFKGLCITIAHRRIIDAIRREKSPSGRITVALPSDVIEETIDARLAVSPPLEDFQKEAIDQILQLFNASAKRCKEVIFYYYIEELDLKDVAAMMDYSVGGLKNKLHDCLQKAKRFAHQRGITIRDFLGA